MANTQQIYDIVNLAANMVLGKKAITAVNTTSFVSLGDQLEETEMRDAFNGVLYDVIMRTVIATMRPMEDDEADGMVYDGFSYGAILQKLYVDVPDAIENPAYKIGEANYQPKYAPIYKPIIKQYLFHRSGTFEFGVSIPDDLYDTAFHSEQEMAVLISAILMAQQNKYKLALADLKRLCRATFIANILNIKDARAVNLLELYNTAHGTTLTPENALLNSDFLLWSAMTINQYSKRLVDPSVIYNSAGNMRRTPKQYQVLTLLENYVSALQYQTKSNVYHDQFVELPHYNEVNFWQGTGQTYAFKDASTVSIEIEGTNSSGQPATTDLTFPYVIGVLYDIEAMGVTIMKEKDKTAYYPEHEFTNHWKKATRGYFNDLSENGIVFYMASTPSQPTNPT